MGEPQCFHNGHLFFISPSLDVCLYAKIRILKQITTKNLIQEAYRNGYLTDKELAEALAAQGDVKWQWIEKFTDLFAKFIPLAGMM